MPPKRGTSSGAGAKARGGSPAAKARASSRGAAKAKAKAAAAPVEEDPKAKLLKEAAELFEQCEPDGKLDGVIKLAQFADIIRAMNTRKCMLWGDDPAPIIKREWTKAGGFEKRELNLEQFKSWWPDFAMAANQEAEEKRAAQEEKEEEAKKAREEKFSGDGVWQIKLKDIPDAIKEAHKKGKTALILDTTPNQRAEAYFLHNGSHIIECKKLIVDKAKGAKAEDLLEEERERMWSGRCFKFGQTVLFRLANTACDLKGTFNSEIFPSLAMLNRAEVAKVLGPENTNHVKDSPFFKMARSQDEEMDLTCMGIHEKFGVVVLSHFSEEDFTEFLQNMIPLDLLQPMKPSVD
mmetsp:Transcript_122463/g.357571  ORF Transcript_122463/g.357571 Transcript_122463/m.357571 type:complete len:350 (-) Transcript_122463:114-1163(-)